MPGFARLNVFWFLTRARCYAGQRVLMPHFRNVLCWLILAVQVSAAEPEYARRIAPLIAPIKLATLGPRAANPRVQKAVYWLQMARRDGQKPQKVVDQATALSGYRKPAASLTKQALLRNLDIANKLGCLKPGGLAEMKRGNAA